MSNEKILALQNKRSLIWSWTGHNNHLPAFTQASWRSVSVMGSKSKAQSSKRHLRNLWSRQVYSIPQCHPVA
ncbi:hypothetical protein Y1Q_0012324 [Alligator mississippiensis]|uniref:Uncharacterized protein n=1 Tax=Alligator mississippiensis TaxID=8496 RepID=A0A151M5A4_ALLMI|nr:hypothetical protein Y1Q_0012324 [Alligator mississippiensis]